MEGVLKRAAVHAHRLHHHGSPWGGRGCLPILLDYFWRENMIWSPGKRVWAGGELGVDDGEVRVNVQVSEELGITSILKLSLHSHLFVNVNVLVVRVVGR